MATERGSVPTAVSWAVVFAGLTGVVLTHFGYPLLVRQAAAAQARRCLGGTHPGPLPSLTVVVPAHNEAEFIQAKIRDTWAQDYPRDLLEIVVVDDGSTDGTAELAESTHPRPTVVRQTPRQGKGAALNLGVARARGDVVVFTDANGSLVAGSLRAIACAFADPRVAVVGGNKHLTGEGAHGEGESLYWELENALKTAESAFGAVVGADGGIYAVRKATYRPLPEGVYADDYWIALDALARGLAVVHAPGAAARESVSRTRRADFERRSRIAAGVWRETLAHLRLLDPRRGWVAIAFLFHRVFRTLLVPLLLPATLAAALLGGRRDERLRLLAAAQTACWVAALVGAMSGIKLLTVPYQFAMTNIAAVRGGLRQLCGRQSALWKRTERGPWR